MKKEVMKNKQNTSLMLLLFCFATLSTFAQSGLTVSADSLVLTPTAGFTINGPNWRKCSLK